MRLFVVCWLLNVPSTRYSVSQGRNCSDNVTCCRTEIEVADQILYLTQPQYTDTLPTSHSADHISQGSHWTANFLVIGMTRPGKIPSQAGFEPRIFRCRGKHLNHKANKASTAMRGDERCLLVGCLKSQQHGSVSQARICSDNCACCHTEIEVGDPTSHLTQSQYTDTGPTSPSTDPIGPGAWQGSHWSASF